MRGIYLSPSSPHTSFTARIKNITCTIVVRPIKKGEVVLSPKTRVGDFHLFVSKLIVSQRRRCGVGARCCWRVAMTLGLCRINRLDKIRRFQLDKIHRWKLDKIQILTSVSLISVILTLSIFKELLGCIS